MAMTRSGFGKEMDPGMMRRKPKKVGKAKAKKAGKGLDSRPAWMRNRSEA